MLMRTDPFREFDRLTQQLFNASQRPTAMPIDAYRKDDWFYVHFDLPGVRAEDVELTVERNVLTVRAERTGASDDGVELIAAERPQGTFTRQLFLGDTLNTDKLEADYNAGVLTVRIPVAEEAKPRRVEISGTDERRRISA
ncbi:MAG TPA: Hsp20/alpha crystallin family protein [Jiangellaceae bacterium]|jgi:HSP20 family protein